MTITDLRPGDVWWAWLGEPEGREQGGRRPVVVISGETYLATADTMAMVVPVTNTRRGWPNHVELEGATEVRGVAMTEQARAISRTRLKTPAGRVAMGALRDMRQWVHDFLEL